LGVHPHRHKSGASVSKSILKAPPHNPWNAVRSNGGITKVKHPYRRFSPASLKLFQIFKKTIQRSAQLDALGQGGWPMGHSIHTFTGQDFLFFFLDKYPKKGHGLAGNPWP
jgi:hypothetical protein